jgi:RNA polymerase sigma-70 factor (ECF subfamily)
MIALDPRHEELDPDTERMVRVAAGDRTAFDELVRRNFDSTVRIVSAMMGSCANAEDIAQDVFLRIYRSRERYVPTARFSTFLGTVIRNTVLNAKRSLSRRPVHLTEFVDDASRNHQPGTTLSPTTELDYGQRIDDMETVAAVCQAIALLPRRQQIAIELVHFRGLSYLKAANEMETSRQAIKSLLGRGRKTLSRTLRDRFR